jgi:hypothetical protein
MKYDTKHTAHTLPPQNGEMIHGDKFVLVRFNRYDINGWQGKQSFEHAEALSAEGRRYGNRFRKDAPATTGRGLVSAMTCSS